MFVFNIRAVFLKKLNLLHVLFPYHDTNEYGETGILPALVSVDYCISSDLATLTCVQMCTV